MHLIQTPTNKNTKAIYLQYDTLDDRREIYHLLGRLSPLRRLAFMRWFLSKAQLGPWPALKPVVAPETVRLAHQAMNDDAADAQHLLECFRDCWALCSAYSGLNLDLALNKLVEMVKGKS